MPRIVFLNRFYDPDISATSRLLTDLTQSLAITNMEIVVIASRQLYRDPNADLPSTETIGNVHVRRVATTRFGRNGLVGRLFDYLSFIRGVRRTLSGMLKQGDTVVVMTDPPLLSVAVTGVIKRNEAVMVNWLQDVFPEVAANLANPWVASALIKLFSGPRNRSLDVARNNIVIGQDMANTIRRSSGTETRLQTIHNWPGGTVISPIDPLDNPLRKEWNLIRRIVIGYVGNMGRAHEFDALIEAIHRINPGILQRDDKDSVCFLMAGSGYEETKLRKQLSDLPKSLVLFKEPQPENRLPCLLSVPDIHIVTLRPAMNGLILPSKIYGILAAGRPIIFIGDPGSEIARLIRDNECGKVVEPGNVTHLHKTITTLSEDDDERLEMGRRARNLYDQSFHRDQALRAWTLALRETCSTE